MHNEGVNADDYLKQYLPDFDTPAKRIELQAFSKEDLIEMLLTAYKNTRVVATMSDLLSNKLNRIKDIAEEPWELPSVDRPPSNFPKE